MNEEIRNAKEQAGLDCEELNLFKLLKSSYVDYINNNKSKEFKTALDVIKSYAFMLDVYEELSSKQQNDMILFLECKI